VLIVSFLNFTGIAHLPKALTEAGFRVAALCPRYGFLAQTRFLEVRYDLPAHFYAGLMRSRLRHAIDRWQPDLLIPGDDVALAFLQNLPVDSLEASVRALLRHSLGRPEGYGVCTDKARFGAVAQQLGLRTPAQYFANDPASLIEAADALGYPLVFKKTLSFAGTGVAYCADAETLRRHVRGFFGSGKPRLKQQLRQHLYEAWGVDPRPLMRPQREQILVQEFIPGSVISHAFVAHEGRYLTGFSYGKVGQNTADTSPSARIQVRDLPEAAEAAQRLAGYLGLTGFACLDFIEDAATGDLYALECNGRPTHTTSLGQKLGVDLCGALAQAERGEPVPGPASRTTSVALFPDAWTLAPATFAGGDSLVPWDDVPLLKAFLDGPAAPRSGSRVKQVTALGVDWLRNFWLERREPVAVPEPFSAPPKPPVRSEPAVPVWEQAVEVV
jgi:hypothetical protein